MDPLFPFGKNFTDIKPLDEENDIKMNKENDIKMNKTIRIFCMTHIITQPKGGKKSEKRSKKIQFFFRLIIN